MALIKDEIVELVQKDENGWYLVRKGGREGWTPSNYLQEVEVPQSRAAPPRPPVAAPKPAAGGGLRPANGASGSTTPSPSGSRPGSSVGGRSAPALAPKPGAKPSILTKPGAGSAASRGGAAPPGQMDLAAALAKRLQQSGN